MKKLKKQGFIFSFLLFFLVQNVFIQTDLSAQTINTIAVGFTKTTEKGSSKEVVKGNLYYLTSKDIVLKVVEPVTQWIVFKERTMLIYYPDEKTAFQFKSKNPFFLPSSQMFIGTVQKDIGLLLSGIGFNLVRNEVKQDMLLTYWEPPQSSKKILGNIVIGLNNNMLALIKIYNPKGELVSEITYRNYFKHGVWSFPMEVISVQHRKGGYITEKVIFSNPKFNAELPEEVINFNLPVNIKVKEIEW